MTCSNKKMFNDLVNYLNDILEIVYIYFNIINTCKYKTDFYNLLFRVKVNYIMVIFCKQTFLPFI